MDVQELRRGLWRWTAPHPAWTPECDRPGGWGRDVGCTFFAPATGDQSGVVVIDPLAPAAGTPEADRFWDALDRDVRIGGHVSILLANEFHSRSAQAILDRHRRTGASTWALARAAARIPCEITNPFRAGDALPGGLTAHPVDGLSDGEVAYHVAESRTLVVGDALIGAGGGRLRVAPEAWAGDDEAARERYRRVRPALRKLLDLPIDMVLVSHGEPVLDDGSAALAVALEAPAWGESGA